MNKDVLVTRGQMTAGGCLVAAILVLQPVKEWFVTREESNAQAAQIQTLKVAISEAKDELTRRLERSSDKIIDRINEVEARVGKNVDKIEHRVETLEANRAISKTKFD